MQIVGPYLARFAMPAAGAASPSGVPSTPDVSPGLSPAASMKVMQDASALPEVQRLDDSIASARGRSQRLEEMLSAQPQTRRKMDPIMYDEIKYYEMRGYNNLRTLVSFGSWALAFGLTRVPALAPYSTWIWIGTMFGVVPKIFDKLTMPHMERRVDEKMVKKLQEYLDADRQELQTLERDRERIFQAALVRLSAEAAADEARTKADPNGRIEVEPDAVTVGGIRVPKRDRKSPAGPAVPPPRLEVGRPLV